MIKSSKKQENEGQFMLYERKNDPIRIHKRSDFDFVSHMHHHMELLICTEGVFAASCCFRTEQLRPGDMMIAFSNDIHAYSKTDGGEGILIIVDPSLLQHFLPYIKKERYENFLLTQSREVIAFGNALYWEYSHDRCMEILVGYLYVLFGTVFKQLPQKQDAARVDTTRFSEILTYLSEHYGEPLSLNSLSHRFGVSASHLSRCFSQTLSCGFLKYLHTLRVEHAKNLLRYSSKSVLEIVYESGFSDQRTFNRVFRELVGMSPKEYRLDCRKG